MADKTFDLTKIGLPVGTHSIQMRLSDDGVTKRDSALSNAVAYSIYSVAGTATNCTINGQVSYSGQLGQGASITLTLGADGTNYKLPTSVTVTGATSNFTRTSDTAGTLVISNPTGSVSFSVVGEQAQVQLAAPVIALSNKTVSWSAIPNASNYALVVDISSPITVTTTSFDLSTLTLTEGYHTIRVMAKGDGVHYLDSELSNVVIYMVEPVGGYDFANDSWATIASQIKAGTDHYNLGDTKTDTVTVGGDTTYAGSYSVTFKIVDNKVGRYVTQSGQSHKVIEIQQIFGQNYNGGVIWNNDGTDPVPSPRPMPPMPYPATSFRDSIIIKRLNEVIVDFLPSALKAVLETTTVYSGDGTQTASSSTNVAATCKLFVASFNEYYGADATYGWANNSETNGKGQFTWYQQAGVTTSNYGSMVKYKIEDTSTAYYYWTRSPYDSVYSLGSAVRVVSNGIYDYDSVSDDDNRVAPCFAW